jgi:glyoxylase-like metal-dependent hydrolase (beta-lactamase superfamily II)
VTTLPVADRWFDVDDMGDSITLITEPYVDPLLASNVWHVRGLERDLVIDTANGFGDLSAAIASLSGERTVIAVATHGHFDHVGGLAAFDDRRCHTADAGDTRSPYLMRVLRADFPEGAEEMFALYELPVPGSILSAVPYDDFDVEGWVSPGAEPTSFVEDGDILDLGDRTIEVLHVPGHTPGSVALWDGERGLLFTGDTLYDGPMDFEDAAAASSSLLRLRELPVRRVFGGHDPSFDGDRMRELVDAELASLDGRGAPYAPPDAS